MKFKILNLILILILLILIIMLKEYFIAANTKQIKELQLNISNMQKQIDIIESHNSFMDSMHYSKCAFILKKGISDDNGDN